MVAIILALWGLLRKLMRARAPQGHYVVGLVAFFIANVGSLTVSGQILADPFIAAFLGLLVGVALSFGRTRLAEPKVHRARVSGIDPQFPPVSAESTG
jgi:hypothetical protein